MPPIDHTLEKRGHGALAAATGGLFCLAAALTGDRFPCVTSGCELSGEIRILGLSLWGYGAAAFFALAGLSLAGRLMWALRLAGVCLAADALLLAWMGLGVPCSSCLAAGAFFPAVFWALHRAKPRPGRAAAALVIVWGLCFTPALFAAAQELAGPWPAYGRPGSGVQIYYSPTCPACRATLRFFLPQLENTDKTLVLYPLARTEADRVQAERFVHALGMGKSPAESLVKSWASSEPPPLGFFQRLKVAVGLYRNRIAFLKAGGREIPLVLMTGAALPGAPETTP